MGTVTTKLVVAAQVDPDEARRVARLILEQDRFQEARVPRPFAGVLRRLAELLEGPGRVIKSWYEAIVDLVPGADATVWVVLAAIVILIATQLSIRLARQRTQRAASPSSHSIAASIDPSDLETAAEDAESTGDLESALRLRFRAGLLRLHSAGVIELTPSMTNGSLTTIVGSPTFATITRTFDEVAYGKRSVRPEDLVLTKTGWPRALDEATSS